MRPYSPARRERDKHYPDARQAAFKRAHGRCEAMALGCTGRAEQTHHIAGRTGPDPHRLENLKVMCAHCHGWTHENPRQARRLGLMRSRLGTVTPPAWHRKDTT